MGYTKGFITQTDRKLIHSVHNSQIVCHPSVTEESFYISRDYNKSCQNRYKIKPPGVVVESILNASPLAAFTHFSGVIQLAECLLAGSFYRIFDYFHYFAPPCIFLISRLSTKACTRVLICPIDDFMLYGLSTESTGMP